MLQTATETQTSVELTHPHVTGISGQIGTWMLETKTATDTPTRKQPQAEKNVSSFQHRYTDLLR